MRFYIGILLFFLVGPAIGQGDSTLTFRVEKRDVSVQAESPGTLQQYVDTLAFLGYALQTPNPQGLNYDLVSYSFTVLANDGLSSVRHHQRQVQVSDPRWDSFYLSGIKIRTASGKVIKVKPLKFTKLPGS
jgi:hypothetical protein